MTLIKPRKKRKNKIKKVLYLINYCFQYYDISETIPIKVVSSKKEAKIFCSSKNFEFQNILFADERIIEQYEQEEDNVAIKESIKEIRRQLCNELQTRDPNDIWHKLDSYLAYDWQYIKYDDSPEELED